MQILWQGHIALINLMLDIFKHNIQKYLKKIKFSAIHAEQGENT